MPTNVLSLLTRLRQLTLHPGLIPQDYIEQLRSMSEDPDKPAPAIPITSADRIRLSALLARAIEDREECPICFDISKTLFISLNLVADDKCECSLESSYNTVCSYLLFCMHLRGTF